MWNNTSGLAFPSPTNSAVESNWKASSFLVRVCEHLVATLYGRVDSRSADHASIMAQGKAANRTWSQEANGKHDNSTRNRDRCMALCSCAAFHCQWDGTFGTSVSGCALHVLWRGEAPPDLPARCDGSDASAFTLQHTHYMTLPHIHLQKREINES